MIALAVANSPGWDASDLEINREGRSYTYDTLTTIGREEGLTPSRIFFITGADAFAELATWHRYPDVLDRAHFVVVARPGTTLDVLRLRLPNLASRMTTANALDASTPRIILLQAQTPGVSSTDIRRRVADGRSIDTLVPAAVSRYIDQNLLYRTAGA